ncbi:hypothetical protein DIPPA_01967 [Diplonema papillatum]|nr:hypothetical protein DIPPA_01967 [Diplonema papillatum]
MLRQLQRSLAREAVREVRAPKAAGVACIVRGTEDLEVLYILRATNPLDRWSGQVAFPGGKHEEGDGSFKATAEREAFEEISVDLADASRYAYLGRADEVPASPQLGVACFVYHQAHPWKDNRQYHSAERRGRSSKRCGIAEQKDTRAKSAAKANC